MTFHINNDGEAGKCNATKGNCPFGNENEHFNTKEEARAFYEGVQSNRVFNTVPVKNNVNSKESSIKVENVPESFISKDSAGNVMITVPAGKYFVGDPCYAVKDNDAWQNFVERMFKDSPAGETVSGVMMNGYPVVGVSTVYGDGEYFDVNDNRSFPVDAGLIGIVDMRVAAQNGVSEDDLEGFGLGHVINFDEPVRLARTEDGDILIHNITIPTGDNDIEDDNVFGEDWDDDDEEDFIFSDENYR